ncbi:MAG TPA: hypothetical protein VGL46_15210 [Pseudonocardiaceae bacterium]|jgi:hypothetical protein
MNTILSSPHTSLPAPVRTTTRTFSGEDRLAHLVAELQTALLVPGVVVPGIEHQAAAAIINAGLPGATYQRQTLHRRLDEHLILDADARSGVRVLACWDERAHRVRMHVAECGAPGLWDWIVAHFAEWETTGRPVPATAAPGVSS